MSRKTTRKATGFTLIEVVVTVSVMSTLLAVGLPAFAGLLQNQRTSVALASLVSQMSHARLAAVKHRRPTILCPSTSGTQCDGGSDWAGGWIVFVERGDRTRPSRPSDLLQVESVPVSRHLRIASTSGRSFLRYLPDGRSAGSNLTIVVCTREGERLGAVVVNNAGRPRVERGSTGAPCPP
ncbi:MAG TPA: GspH/FimT family pseudopilin [Luteimonas sp.]